jgi:hypothetical protein
MHTYNTYEKAPRQSLRYTGLFAIICLFASMLLAWAVMRTSLVKTGLEMMGSSSVTTGMRCKSALATHGYPQTMRAVYLV